jgi:hypothetical protein
VLDDSLYRMPTKKVASCLWCAEMAEIFVVAITVSCTLLLLEAANFNMRNPYYGGFFIFN